MLKINKLYKSYIIEKKKYNVLKGITFSIKKGEFVSVMGSSGSGKTTLLNCIACYTPADSGEILLENENIAELKDDRLARIRNQKLGFIFQDFMLFDGLNIMENILLPSIIQNKIGKEVEQNAERLCKLFHIEKIKKKYPYEVSGGEKQRTAVARALINKPLLILADEPTGNLDSKSGKAVIDSFLQAQSVLSATIFMVTHDSYAASFCNRVIILKDGEIFDIVNNNGSQKQFQEELLERIKEMNR